MEISDLVNISAGVYAGYMTGKGHHMDLGVALKTLAGILIVETGIDVFGESPPRSDNVGYSFYVLSNGAEIILGYGLGYGLAKLFH
ncbi:hypothetical protein HZA98_05000 [Candidatus Woesearchaeota archaeon]|nr:hypothetical protein [Candidatus Woesearchaeota archaeon]